jgi:N-acetylneuraminic acid mutarotase
MGERRTALISLLILCLAILSPLVSEAEESWTTVEPMPTARCRFGIAAVDGKIYAIGGQGAEGVLATNQEYDPASNTWTTKEAMPTARCDFAVASYDGKIYTFGGRIKPTEYAFIPEGYLGVTEVYNPKTDTWVTKTSMPTNRCGLSANVVDGKIYLTGGIKYYDRFPYVSLVNETEVYDPQTDSWTTENPIPNAVSNYASAVIDNKIYVIGGANITHLVTYNQVYDPESNTWTEAKPIPTAVRYAGGAATRGGYAPKRIYVIGGDTTEFPYGLNLTQIYDPKKDAWICGTPMPTPRDRLAVAVTNDILYAIGGRNGYSSLDYLATNEMYTPDGYVSEFPSWIPMLLLFTTFAVSLVIYKRRIHKTSMHHS